MNNKTILEFGFRVILRIMEISEGVFYCSVPYEELWRSRRVLSALAYGLDG